MGSAEVTPPASPSLRPGTKRMLFAGGAVTDLERHARFASRIGVELVCLPNLTTVPLLSNFELVAADYDKLSADDRARLLRAFSAKIRTALILTSEGAADEQVLALIEKGSIAAFLSKLASELNPTEL